MPRGGHPHPRLCRDLPPQGGGGAYHPPPPPPPPPPPDDPPPPEKPDDEEETGAGIVEAMVEAIEEDKLPTWLEKLPPVKVPTYQPGA